MHKTTSSNPILVGELEGVCVYIKSVIIYKKVNKVFDSGEGFPTQISKSEK